MYFGTIARYRSLWFRFFWSTLHLCWHTECVANFMTNLALYVLISDNEHCPALKVPNNWYLTTRQQSFDTNLQPVDCSDIIYNLANWAPLRSSVTIIIDKDLFLFWFFLYLLFKRDCVSCVLALIVVYQ